MYTGRKEIDGTNRREKGAEGERQKERVCKGDRRILGEKARVGRNTRRRDTVAIGRGGEGWKK